MTCILFACQNLAPTLPTMQQFMFPHHTEPLNISSFEDQVMHTFQVTGVQNTLPCNVGTEEK